MRIQSLFSVLMFTSTLFSQANFQRVDSLANLVNTQTGEFEKALVLEKALNQIVIDDLDFERFKSNLKVEYFNPRMLLVLDAQEYRASVLRGREPDRIHDQSESNPYKRYFLANSNFFFGEEEKALMLFKEIAPRFKALQDTFYTASTYNNIGSIHYINNRLDSALSNFLLAKQFTYWFNEMLEANILAVSNTLKNKELSANQIKTIHNNNPNTTNGVYYNNAYEFFNQYNPAKRDSLVEKISNVFTNLSDVPDPLYRVFIKENLLCDSVATELLKMPSHVYYENAIRALLQSSIIQQEPFSSEVLDSLKNKSSLMTNIYALEIFNQLDSLNKYRFVVLNQSLADQSSETEHNELKALIDSYKTDLQNSKNHARNVLTISALVLMVFIFLITTIYFRQKANASKSLNEALGINQELELARVALEREMNATRLKITNISRENLHKLEELKQLIQNPEYSEINDELLKDLNILRIHQDGITRFKINRFCEDLQSEEFIPLKSVLSTNELQIFKLMVLGFKSKEIARLVDVTHQHVNNQRHRIRTLLQEAGYSYEELVTDLKSSLYKG